MASYGLFDNQWFLGSSNIGTITDFLPDCRLVGFREIPRNPTLLARNRNENAFAEHRKARGERIGFQAAMT